MCDDPLRAAADARAGTEGDTIPRPLAQTQSVIPAINNLQQRNHEDPDDIGSGPLYVLREHFAVRQSSEITERIDHEWSDDVWFRWSCGCHAAIIAACVEIV